VKQLDFCWQYCNHEGNVQNNKKEKVKVYLKKKKKKKKALYFIHTHVNAPGNDTRIIDLRKPNYFDILTRYFLVMLALLFLQATIIELENHI
jgi:hypothetical protein